MQTSQFRQQKLQQFDIRQNVYNNTWKTDLMGAMCANPLCEHPLFLNKLRAFVQDVHTFLRETHSLLHSTSLCGWYALIISRLLSSY